MKTRTERSFLFMAVLLKRRRGANRNNALKLYNPYLRILVNIVIVSLLNCSKNRSAVLLTGVAELRKFALCAFCVYKRMYDVRCTAVNHRADVIDSHNHMSIYVTRQTRTLIALFPVEGVARFVDSSER